jgi:hypothetical protein
LRRERRAGGYLNTRSAQQPKQKQEQPTLEEQMKFNKWTLGLAALGVVSLASAAKADEKQNFVQTALSSTTISGYVDTSVEWQLCPNGELPSLGSAIPFRGATKQDGFNLNVVKLSIEKPLDESEWASGYKVDLLFGPDAVAYNQSVNSHFGRRDSATADFSVKQAYVALRAPIGNGVEFKIGTFDTIIGYEVFEAGNNPNFTRSWAYAVEPTEHTGILAAYRVNDMLSLSAGVANTLSAGINNRNTDSGNGYESFWCKTWMGSIALTAPQSWGWAAGSSLYGGIVSGFNGRNGASSTGVVGTPGYDSQVNYYAGLTLNTPVAGLKGGVAFDRVCNSGGISGVGEDILGLYASYQATSKLSLHARGELGWWKNNSTDWDSTSLTGTVQYDLWQNVISRLEIRWDEFCYNSGTETSTGVYANIIYKF